MNTYRRSRRDSVTTAPPTTFDIGPRRSVEEDKPDDGGKFGLLRGVDVELNMIGEWDELQRFVSSPSAPTTPRTKRKIHFIEPSPDDIAPRRSNTAPPGLRIASTTNLDREPTVSREPDSEEIQPDLISFEEPEEAPSKASEDLGEVSLNSQERDQDFYDMEVEMEIYNDDSTPTEDLPLVSQDENDDADDAKDPIFSLRHAKSHSISGTSTIPQERSTSAKFYRTSSASGLYSKPAYSPIIKAHVAGSPIRFDFCTTPVGNNDDSERLGDIPRLSRSQTGSFVSGNSASSTTWDDIVTASADERSGPPSDASSSGGNTRSSSGLRSEIALETIRRKLSTMSRSRKANVKHSRMRSPEPISSPDDVPAVPPNTRATSDTPKKGHGGHSAKHSRSDGSSPLPTPAAMVRSEPQSPTQSARVSPRLKPALKHAGPSVPTGVSTMYDRSVPSHKDSLELVRHRMGEEWLTVDPQLSCTRDSIVLAKQRWERYPRSHAVIDEQSRHTKYGGLSTIMDASPPDHKAYWAARREQLAKQKEVDWQREIGGHPENDHDCPICEVERPRTKRLASLRAG
ncbi:unnamed protein product [Aureobasidium vineae]|uniref:Uncharacterized protein n=1 Tax=Aureobasidium vineae TaxID=2773715 RepID=A0A9N8J8A8_9PEZI|nr:unnamed protein product [Aureobasidium vineae]